MLKPSFIANQLAVNREHGLYDFGLAESMDVSLSKVGIRLTHLFLDIPDDRSATNSVLALELPNYGLNLHHGQKDEDWTRLGLDFSGNSFRDTLRFDWNDYTVYLGLLATLGLNHTRGTIELKAGPLSVTRMSKLSGVHVNTHFGVGAALATHLTSGSVLGFSLELFPLKSTDDESTG